MIIDLTPEQEARLARIAEHEGKDVQQFVLDVALALLEDDTEIQEILEERLKEADRGIFVDHEEVKARFRTMLTLK